MVTWVLEGAQDLDEGAQGGGWTTIDERVSCAWPDGSQIWFTIDRIG
jgi:hypothetical protein